MLPQHPAATALADWTERYGWPYEGAPTLPTYTIRLDQLHASFMRDKQQDDLSAWLTVAIDGVLVAAPILPQEGAPPGNPVVGQLSSGVHSGDTVRFSAFRPLNASSWELSFEADGPDDSIVTIAIIVANTHGEPSEAVQRFLVKSVFSLVGGGVGAFPDLHGILQVFVGALGGLIGGSAGDEVGSALFSDAPQCQGPVFAHSHILSLGALGRLPYSDFPQDDPAVMVGQWATTVSSDPITDTKPDCGHPPDYQLTFSILRRDQLTFGPAATLVFSPATGHSPTDWLGEWVYQVGPSDAPRITCSVSRSAVTSGTLHVMLAEHFGTWNGAEITSFALDALLPETVGQWRYVSDVLPSARHLLTRLVPISSKPAHIGGAPVETSEPHPGASIDPELTTRALGAILPGHFQSGVENVVDKVDSISVPEKGVTLCLYTQELDGKNIGFALRYIRRQSLAYTETDVLLFPAKAPLH